MNFRTISISLLFIIISATTILPQWVLKDTGLGEYYHGAALDALDNDRAIIAVGGPNLYFTEDRGDTWIPILLPEDGNHVSDISMFSRDLIWYATSDGKIYGTTNGGEAWELQFYDPFQTQFMNYIEIFDWNDGIAMGDGEINNHPVFLKTIDGGKNWIDVNQTEMGEWSGDQWRRLDFVNPNTGYFYESGSEEIQQLYKTIDGGINWTPITHYGSLALLKFYNQSIGVTFSFGSNCTAKLNKTIDGGNTWETFSINTAGYPDDFEFIPGDPSKIWLVTLSGLFYNTNLEEPWSTEILFTESAGRDLEFTDPLHGWLLCDDGIVYYTDNNGGMVTNIEGENNFPADFILNQNYPNPFNPTTTISFSVPVESDVQLIIYDNIGRIIKTLVNDTKPVGTYSINFNADNLSSGIYFARLVTDTFTETIKMVFLK